MKGYGWMLKSLSKVEQRCVEEYLTANHEWIFDKDKFKEKWYIIRNGGSVNDHNIKEISE